MKNLLIRNENVEDWHIVENTTRTAFWNVYTPGACEHYLIHQLRQSPDFIRDLAFVVEMEGNIIGSIFFSKSKVLDESDNCYETITFGPVSILPAYQGRGIGERLIRHAIDAAIKQKHTAILIFGDFDYYHRFGFKHAQEFGISDSSGRYPAAHLALELFPTALEKISGKAYVSELFQFDPLQAEAYDRLFEPKEKKITPSQEKIAEIASRFLS